ncbi:hypothetical protein CUR178_04626 [Leishmania enriettii]|uniref:DUF676 domain-containing protein n=1 Tax=Leishmania enriettii TaxID=5663 RepID=A0A836KLP3_LEIEN|nr:hypothetical protein CUR178_04626 [Leishmania enriettii]
MNPIAAHQPSQTEAPSCAHPCLLHFVLFHHGYHGEGSEFKCWCKIRELIRQGHKLAGAEARDSAPCSAAMKFVFITPCCNDGFNADDGVMLCGSRFSRYVKETVSMVVAEELGIVFKKSRNKKKVTRDAADGMDRAATWRKPKLSFSAVGHSMGGLVLRAALPDIVQYIESTFTAPPYECEVSWEVLCTLSTPHLGVRYMDSKCLTFLGGCIGSALSRALADMFWKDEVLTRDLVSDVYLGAWSRFKRRVLVNAVNDHTVLTYSSSFLLTLHVLKRVGGSLSKEQKTTVKMLRKSKTTDGKRYPDISTAYLASQGILCASSFEELCTNGVLITEISPTLWPTSVLPEERLLAERILHFVGPLELHLVDFRPRYAYLTSSGADRGVSGGCAAHRPGLVERETMRQGAYESCHTALMCKYPFFCPCLFGFVPQFVLSELVGTPLSCATLVLPPRCSLSCTCEDSCDDAAHVRSQHIHTECC